LSINLYRARGSSSLVFVFKQTSSYKKKYKAIFFLGSFI
jgi:hypothetical protein